MITNLLQISQFRVFIISSTFLLTTASTIKPSSYFNLLFLQSVLYVFFHHQMSFKCDLKWRQHHHRGSSLL